MSAWSAALSSVRGSLLENGWLKLLSLAFATLLWMFVVGEKRSEVSLSVPLELTGVPENLMIVSRVPETVRIRLNGPRTLLSALNPQQLSVALDLKDIEPGVSTFENLPSRLKLPKRIEVTYVSPAVVTLEADQKARKLVAVKARLRGDPALGFRLGATRIDPPEVELEGAARVLRALKEVPTEVVDVSGLDETMERLVELSFPDPTLRRASRGPVDLRVDVVEEKANREFVQVPVEVVGRRWTTVPRAVDVRIEGGARTVGKLARDAVTAYVAASGAKAAPREPVRVLVRVPKGVRVLEVVPRTVELRGNKPGVSSAAEGEPSGEKGEQP